MRNPWLDIPLAEYEGHMALPAVGQAKMLADELEFAVRQHAPKSIAVLGCAGGNGFDRLVGTGVERIAGIDINPAYVEAVRSRFHARIPGLELHVADIQRRLPELAPVDLLFAALILEYVDVPTTMSSLQTLCTPGGALVIILQAASSSLEAVSPSPHKSMRLLSPAMRLLDQANVQNQAIAAGFSLASSRVVNLQSGKRFIVLSFRTER
jgi:trans-aconitate methyltransferase